MLCSAQRFLLHETKRNIEIKKNVLLICHCRIGMSAGRGVCGGYLDWKHGSRKLKSGLVVMYI